MTPTTDVLVIGAGPTGLTMANVLARNGVKVRIVDKKSGPAQESRAVVVHARTLELLDKLHLAEKAIEGGARMGGVQLFIEGKRTGGFSFGVNNNKILSTPYPFTLIYGQDQTEHLLTESLAELGVQVEWNTELLDLEQTPQGTRARVLIRDAGEVNIEAAWTVGADGAHSSVRHALSLGFRGQTYTQSLFVADLDIKWDLKPQRAGLDLGRGFFLFVPMHEPGRFRLFGTLPTELSERETLTLDDVRSVLAKYSGLHVTIPRARWISVYRSHLRMVEQFRVGHVFLIGDAAHIHSPAGGQGMNTGIGDACNLAWKLALVLKGQARATLLDSYHAERVPFAHKILGGSDRAFHFMTTTNPFVRRLRFLMFPPLFGIVSRIPGLGPRALWLISQLWTSYHGSPVVAESGTVKKGPRAGDRAPDGLFQAAPEAGQHLFTRLQDLDHHLFLFMGRRQPSALRNPHTLAERLQAFLSAYALPIHFHTISTGNQSLHQLYGADEPSLFLIRPDGHIAYRGGAQDLDGLQSYLDGLFCKHTIPVSV